MMNTNNLDILELNDFEMYLSKVEVGAGSTARSYIESLLNKMKNEKLERNSYDVLLQYDGWLFGMLSYLLMMHQIDTTTFLAIQDISKNIYRT